MTNPKLAGRLAIALSGASLLALFHTLRAWQSGLSEDAFILFRYAEHLAAGHGLVWNVGEPPVEGFTSLLQVLILSIRSLGGGESVVAFSQLIGVGSAVLACWTSAWLALEASGGDRRTAILTAFGVAIASPIAVWARGGLETVTFTALLSGAMAAWLRDVRRGRSRRASSIAFFVATLSRPEAFGIACVSLAVDLVRSPRGDPGTRLRRLAGWWPYFALLGVFLAWKLAYFDQILPNTYYAKTGGGLWAAKVGVGYLLWFAREYWIFTLLALAAVPLVLRRNVSLGLVYLVVATASYAVPILLSGGGQHYAFRYLVPVIPLLLAAAAIGAVTAWDSVQGRPPVVRRLAAVTALAVVAIPLAMPTIETLAKQPRLLARPLCLVDRDAVEGSYFVQIGRALREIVPPGRKIGSIAVGAIGYYSKRPILDLLGLNDPVIARTPIERDRHDVWRPGHMKGSAERVLEVKPEFLLLQATPPTDEPDVAPSADTRTYYPFVDDLLESEEFNALYQPESHRIEEGWLRLYRKRHTEDSGDPAGPFSR